MPGGVIMSDVDMHYLLFLKFIYFTRFLHFDHFYKLNGPLVSLTYSRVLKLKMGFLKYPHHMLTMRSTKIVLFMRFSVVFTRFSPFHPWMPHTTSDLRQNNRVLAFKMANL